MLLGMHVKLIRVTGFSGLARCFMEASRSSFSSRRPHSPPRRIFLVSSQRGGRELVMRQENQEMDHRRRLTVLPEGYDN